MKAQVELIYDSDCPNVRGARQVLLQAFAHLNLPPQWTEWERGSQESPRYARQYGSPTILVNGQDVGGAEPAQEADCCRVYLDGPAGTRGVPRISRVMAALDTSQAREPAGARRKPAGWWRSLAPLPGLGAALLPVGGCPACWPVYSAILASLGLTFLLEATHVLWITVAFLCVALMALAFQAKARGSYGPLLLGAASVATTLLFKFAWMIDALVYVGLAGLVAASFWNAWPRVFKGADACPACSNPVRQEPRPE